MKSILSVIIFICGVIFSSNAQSSNAKGYASKVALRMKDTLSLSDAERTQVYNISIQLSMQKANVWQQYAGSDSLISLNLQQIENTRDSLYRPVLGETKFILYQQKKRYLLNNN